MARRPFYIIFLAFLFLMPPAVEGGNLSGRVRIAYADYQGEYNGKTVDANGFEQSYSLAYSTNGAFAKGRAGTYSLMFGGLLGAIDSEIMGQDINESRHKFLYSGHILLAPGGLPFRLEIFSSDTSAIATDYASLGYMRGGHGTYNRIPYDLRDGTNRTTGFTFLAGIQNGRYRGAYRDVLSMFPRLMIDYEETVIKDTESLTPRHTRDRNLAFVSLNKKKNWFHYRFHDYTDFLNPSSDYTRKEVLLGTIDHMLRREWIYLTNWIQISVDGSMARQDSNFNNRTSTQYILDLQGMLSRRRYSAYATLLYRRESRSETDSTSLTKNLSIPVNVHGTISANTDWRVALNASMQEINYIAPFVADSEDKEYSIITKVNANKLRPFVFESQVSLMSSDQYDNRPESLQRHNMRTRRANASLRTYSNSRYKKPDYFSAELGVGATMNEAEATSNDSYNTRLSFTWTRKNQSGGYFSLSQSTSYARSTDRSVLNSSTAFKKGFSPTAKLKHSILVKFVVLSDPDNDKNNRTLSAEHKINYRLKRTFVLDSTTSALFSNTYQVAPSPFEHDLFENIRIKQTFYHRTEVKYIQSRQLQGSASVILLHLREAEDGNDVTAAGLEQNLGYRWYTSNGIIRELANLTEELIYETSGDSWFRRFKLSGSYYPTKTFYMKSFLRLEEKYREADAKEFFLAAGFSWPKMQIELSYAYRDSNEAKNENKENVVSLKLDKTI